MGNLKWLQQNLDSLRLITKWQSICYKEEISRAHYGFLTKLQPVYRDGNINRIRKLYDEVKFDHRALQALGKSQEQYSGAFVPS